MHGGLTNVVFCGGKYKRNALTAIQLNAGYAKIAGNRLHMQFMSKAFVNLLTNCHRIWEQSK
ncbi:hypothetical protein CHK_1647 [Christensenella hongkongensis]|uniref:Uncharacterized protein n=1 Tax=Christensenella hongkongensis TaxID=270498 RepID=A0A0M2NIQ4_9FIRM|nr:hypothetical protein CHK_1647 [Christensenella hongkongensis]